ncbi:uncharacterized protein LOC115590955 [Sparus aurata]|uniref:uncharacterized protein LOC115590955 n=1 Tax=Sparus aurata TaxID=8175 RepID=UPI0011C14F58|nr:uncharacterized protein LOC115590955 [Sparus aurata]XP_030288312.1 uncharacterized protein LOC115590955 [Sparus aurata]
MNQCNDGVEGVIPSKTSPQGEHDSQIKSQSSGQQHTPNSAGPGPVCSCVSFKTGKSMELLTSFKEDAFPVTELYGRRASAEPGPEPSCVSFKSDQSIDHFIDFKQEGALTTKRVNQESSKVSSDQSSYPHHTHLDSIFMLLEENIVTFVKTELKMIKKDLSLDKPECFQSRTKDEEVFDGEDEEQRRSSREAFLKITLCFLRTMNQEKLAECLQSSKNISL